jgi:excisionase family DNA binding protein
MATEAVATAQQQDWPSAAGPGALAEVMTAQQIAELLQMRVSTVEDYARRHVLPSIKLGRHRRFIRSDVEKAITELSHGALMSPHWR